MELQSSLTSLPTEIVFLIFTHLLNRDLLSLRQVSKSFLHVTTPWCFSKLTLNSDPRNGRYQILLVQFISDSIANSVHTLNIRLVERGEEDNNGINTILCEHLPSFLSKLQNLKTVTYVNKTNPFLISS